MKCQYFTNVKEIHVNWLFRGEPQKLQTPHNNHCPWGNKVGHVQENANYDILQNGANSNIWTPNQFAGASDCGKYSQTQKKKKGCHINGKPKSLENECQLQIEFQEIAKDE